MTLAKKIGKTGILLILLAGCKPKPIDIQVKQAPTKMVVSSTFLPGGALLVLLTRNFSGQESIQNDDGISVEFYEKLIVKNALVTITHNNITDTLFEAADGIYISDSLQFSDYDKCTLYAKDNTAGQEITAETIVLPFYNFDTLRPYKLTYGSVTTCRVYYELTDDLTKENYYVVNYIRKDETKKGRRIDVNKLFSDNGASVETDFDLLNDQNFTDGKYRADKILKGVKSSDSLAISLASISRGYYEFLTAFKRSGSLINVLTSEPITYPTNVKNGYGYFNVYTPNVIYIDMKLH